MTFSPTPRTCFMRASSSLSAPDAASSGPTISAVRANEPASSTRLRASSVSKMLMTPHATLSRRCSSPSSARCAGRGLTSAIVSATAAATATMKKKIFERNTAASLLQRQRITRWNLHTDLGLALRTDVDGVIRLVDPPRFEEHAQLVLPWGDLAEVELAGRV